MCTVVRFVGKLSGALPWDRSRMTINLPAGLPRAATMFILRETLRLIGAAQAPEPNSATCFCGEPVELPASQSPAPFDRIHDRHAATTTAGPAVRHGA